MLLADHFCKSFIYSVLYWAEIFSSVQSPSRVWFFAASWTAACQASLPIASSQFSQTHVHWVCDAFQPSHPLSSPSPPAFNLSQHQGLFKWVSSLHQVAKVLLYISNFWKKKRTIFISVCLMMNGTCSEKNKAIKIDITTSKNAVIIN